MLEEDYVDLAEPVQQDVLRRREPESRSRSSTPRTLPTSDRPLFVTQLVKAEERSVDPRKVFKRRFAVSVVGSVPDHAGTREKAHDVGKPVQR